MNENPFASLEVCFGDLPDPRRLQGRCDHELVEIILVAVCAVLCGAESWSEVEEFGEAKEAWTPVHGVTPSELNTRLRTPNSVPAQCLMYKRYFIPISVCTPAADAAM